jgi:hypothetical protein
VCLLISAVTVAQAEAQVLYSCSNQDDQLRTIDPTDGSTINQISITVAVGTVSGCTGMATQPGTQVLHAILKISGGGSSRVLATINTETGVATVIGGFNTGFAGIAFSCSKLYGVTGDGGEPSETLFEVSTSDASVTQLLALGNGDDGETIGFNPDDGYMYHASGHDSACAGPDEGVCFERIDLDTLALTNIDISGGALIDEETQALTWWSDQGVFLWKQDHASDAPLFRVATDGSETLVGDMDHQSKGLAFVPVTDGASCIQDQTISGLAADPAQGTAGESSALSATASSGLPVSFGSGTPAVCTVSGNTVNYLMAGTCTVTADQAGNDNYNAAPQVTLDINVKKNQVISGFTAIPSSGKVGRQSTLKATASSGLPVSFGSNTPAVCTVSGNNAYLIKAGICTVTADQAGDDTYYAAPQVTLAIGVSEYVPIPTLSLWGLLVMLLMVVGIGSVMIRLNTPG